MPETLRTEIAFSSLPDLMNCPSPPLTLWVEYEDKEALELLKRLPHHGLGIVGTRMPQSRSRALMESTFRKIAGLPFVILSGMARGIDAEAHELAIDFRLPTIGVLAHGLDFHYPEETLALRRRVLAAGGLMITEYPPSNSPLRHQFLQRNRLIAGLSRAIWVVQAGQTSGAINTAVWAREADRTVYVTPSFPGDATMAGNEFLLKESFASLFFSAESLGSTWIEHYATLYATTRKRRTASPSDSDGDSLFKS